MSEEHPEAAAELRFEYPRAPWRLALLCHLLMLSLVWLLYPRAFPSEHQWAFLVGSLAYLSWVSIFVFAWPLSLLTHRPIVLSEDGIAVGKRFTPWDEVERINHGPLFFWRGLQVRIMVRGQKIGFFDIPESFKQARGLILSAYPFIFRDVLPVIRCLKPDIPISPFVQRLMADPERAGAPRRWLVLGGLSLNVAAIGLLLSPYCRTIFHQMIAAGALMFVSANFFGWAVPFLRDSRDSFLRCALACPVLVAGAAWAELFGSSEFVAFQVIATTALAMSIAGIVVLAATRQLSGRRQILIALALLATPAAIYGYAKSTAWPLRDITHLISDEDLPTPMWGKSGTYMSVFMEEDVDHVLHMPTLTRKPIPRHEGYNVLAWLDDRLLIRSVGLEEGQRELWVYDFRKEREFQVPTLDDPRVGYTHPLCPEGRRLVWIDLKEIEEGAAARLRVWNVETNQEETPPRTLPPHVQWDSAAWLDAKQIAVYGREPESVHGKPRNLHLLLVTLGSAETRHLVSSHSAANWHPIPGLPSAFATTAAEDEGYIVRFVALTTDETIRLPGTGGLPYAVPSAGCAFRITTHRGKRVLARFDFKTRQERSLCRVPGGMVLMAVSRTGRFAVLGPESEFMGIPMFALLHVPSGKVHRIRLSGFTMGFGTAELTGTMPYLTPLSPDERMLVLETVSLGAARTVLCSVPAGWPDRRQ